MKRIWLKNGDSRLYQGSLQSDAELVRFVDDEGHEHTLARTDVASVALDSGGAHPDDGEVAQLLST
jgi:hypothetical protein